MNNFGERLRYLRKLNNLKQSDVAEMLELSGSAIGSWERSLREPNLELVGKLAEKFGVTTDYLIGVSDEMEPPRKQDPPTDLRQFLDQQQVMFNGVPLTDTDKQRINDILTGLFYYARRQGD